MILKKENNLTNRTIDGFIWSLAGTGTQAILSIAILTVLARLLTPDDFGVVGAALVVVGFSQIFCQMGVGPAIVQRKDINHKHLYVGFTLSFLLGCFFGGVIALISKWISLFFHMPDLNSVIKVLALMFPVTGLSVVSEAMLQREMQFKKISIVQFLSYFIGYGLFGLFLAWKQFGVWSLVYANLGQATIKAILLQTISRHKIGVSFSGKELRQLLEYGAGFSLGRLANYFAIQADNIIVGRYLGAGALGLYGRAYQFLMMPANLFGSVVDRVLFPAMSSVHGDQCRFGRAYLKSLGLVILFVLPLGVFFVVVAPELTLVLLGQKWVGMIRPFQILAGVLVFRTAYKICDSLAYAAGVVYRRAWRQCFYAGAVLAGASIGCIWGLPGVSFGVSAAILLNYILMLHLSVDLTKISWEEIFKLHFRHLVLGIFIGVVVYLSAHIGRSLHLPAFFILIITCFVGSTSFILSLLFCKKLFSNEWNFIRLILKDRVIGMFRANRNERIHEEYNNV